MKPDRRNVFIGAGIIAIAAVMIGREGRRPACAGGSCCPLPLNFSVLASNAWTAAESTNARPVQPASESTTNRQR